MARWVTVQTLRAGWYKFWQDSQKISKSVWQRWAVLLGLGFGLCALAMLGLTITAKAQIDHGLQIWDARWLLVLAEALPLSFSKAITWESPGNMIVMLPVVVVFIGYMVARAQPLLAATMMAAYGLQFALVWIGWGYWNRDRPALIADGMAASGLHSFPSGHTVVVITVYGLLAYLWARASRNWVERCLIILAMVFWIGMVISSRLVLGAHWPSDVIVGVVIGVAWLATVILTLSQVKDTAYK
ncbi:MAG: phosphatase PAP2 family protein [Nodosilinea sp.]